MRFLYRITINSLIVILAVHTGWSKTPDSMNRARIKPTLVEMDPGAEQQFYVVKYPGRLTAAYATNKTIWFVEGIPGGNETVGTIDQQGLYRAPKKAPKSPESTEIYTSDLGEIDKVSLIILP